MPSSVQVDIGRVDDAPIRVDPSQFDQLLLNLALNARDAMPGGGVLRITVAVDPGPGAGGGAAAVIQVSDTGAGIDPASLRHIFEPFFTTKPTGTGLGLAISRSIIKAHDSRLGYRANQPRGACFYFVLPAQLETPR